MIIFLEEIRKQKEIKEKKDRIINELAEYYVSGIQDEEKRAFYREKLRHVLCSISLIGLEERLAHALQSIEFAENLKES